MAKQQLFYERATPVSPQRHGNWYIDTAGTNYEFARQVHSVPLVAAEMSAAAREYTIVFAGGDAVVPVVLLGVEAQQNVYITDEGNWDAQYIPAFVRRYPFIFSSGEGDTLTLCIDEGWSACNQEGRGERLFDEAGKGTPYTEKMFGFAKEYQRQFKLTQDYCAKLQELDLLEQQQANMKFAGGVEKSLTGFKAVSRDKLKALPADTLHELAQTNQLELTYLHLQAMNNISLMIERAAKRSPSLLPAAE